MSERPISTRERRDPSARPGDTYQRFRSEVMAGGAVEEAAPDQTVGGERGLVGIGVIVALLVLLALWSIWAFVFVAGLLISIFLHELGHFVTARGTGMKVTQFFMGMGPKLWSFRRGEVEYGVRALPVGAFVRIVGMNNLDDVEAPDEARAYRTKSFPRRLLVITAGSLMHMLIAIVLLFGLFVSYGRLQESGQVQLMSIAPGSPAAIAGLEEGDIIRSIDGVSVTTADRFVDAIRSSEPGTTVSLEVERASRTFIATTTLEENPNPGNEGVGYLGVGSDSFDYVRQSAAGAAGHALGDLGPGAWNSVKGVVQALNPINLVEHLTGSSDNPETRPATVVGVTRYSGQFGDQEGLPGVLLMLAGVNVFVGVFNLLPLLPFDGGHAAIAIYERVRSRRGRPYHADVAKMMPVAMTVMALLAFLLFTGLYLDITQPL